MYQCGLPKEMAIELFKPFVMRELVQRELASNITNGLNNSMAISFGSPHWYIFKKGPTTITECKHGRYVHQRQLIPQVLDGNELSQERYRVSPGYLSWIFILFKK